MKCVRSETTARLRRLWICFFHHGQVQGRGEPRSVGAVLAVDQNRLCGFFHEGNQSNRLSLRQFVSRRHAEVDVDDPEADRTLSPLRRTRAVLCFRRAD